MLLKYFYEKIYFFTSAIFFDGRFTQSSDELTIRKVLDNQIKAWNKGDIEDFMQGYWKNDSLMFIGKNGINWGWQKTLENYKEMLS